MKRFIEGQSRTQGTLLPEMIDEYVEDANPVRIVDVFVDELDLEEHGFTGVNPADTGRPAYHPAVLLKLYIYGYLNRIQSSRRLEREAQRNIELMWLLGRLTPDFKTIANFRKDNGKGIRGVCRQFVMLCRELGLFAEAIVAIDGSKFKAVNNRDRNFTSAKLQRRMKEIETSIERYLIAMDSADRQEPEVAKARKDRLQEKVSALKKRMKELAQIEEQLNDAPDHQISLTDPDARSMKTRGEGIVGYNVQTAVDTKHHLIVAHEVINAGVDRDQLSPMAKLAQAAMGSQEITAIADRGYFKSEEILACHEADISPMVAKTVTSKATHDNRFGRTDFIYDAQRNEYICPAGDRLIWRFARVENGLKLHRYWSSNCQQCSLKNKCTPSKQRRISRWEHEEVLETMQARVDQSPDCMRIRRETVEHPFGTLKSWMGHSHFLTRGLDRVRTEMSLHVLAYNMKRAINIMSVTGLMEAMKA